MSKFTAGKASNTEKIAHPKVGGHFCFLFICHSEKRLHLDAVEIIFFVIFRTYEVLDLGIFSFLFIKRIVPYRVLVNNNKEALIVTSITLIYRIFSLDVGISS